MVHAGLLPQWQPDVHWNLHVKFSSAASPDYPRVPRQYVWQRAAQWSDALAAGTGCALSSTR